MLPSSNNNKRVWCSGERTVSNTPTCLLAVVVVAAAVVVVVAAAVVIGVVLLAIVVVAPLWSVLIGSHMSRTCSELCLQ